MADYETLKRNLQTLRDNRLRIKTQLEQVIVQEQQEMAKLAERQVTDIDAAIANAKAQIEQIQVVVDSSLTALEVASR